MPASEPIGGVCESRNQCCSGPQWHQICKTKKRFRNNRFENWNRVNCVANSPGLENKLPPKPPTGKSKGGLTFGHSQTSSYAQTVLSNKLSYRSCSSLCTKYSQPPLLLGPPRCSWWSRNLHNPVDLGRKREDTCESDREVVDGS